MRLITIFILAFVAYLVIKSILGLAYLYRKKQQADHRIKEQPGGEMAEDPMCHTYIPKATALKQSVAGEVFYFCGRECAEAFSKKQ